MPFTVRSLFAPRLAPLDIVVLAVVMMGAPSGALAITLGQVDDFQTTGTAGWGGSFATHQTDVGPNGTDDHSLQATGFGSGPGGKLLIHNSDQWTGDWTGSGVTQISLDMRNPNNEALTIRLGIAGPNGFGSGGVGDTYATIGQNLPADNQWHHLSFDVTPTEWEYVGQFDGTSIEEALADVTMLRLIHNPDPSFMGIDIDGSFFVDNITAEAAAAEQTGDYNKDGVVDAADYVMWRKTLTQPADPEGSGADGDGDGMIDHDDYDFWAERFGEVVPMGGGSMAVPEPAASALAACGLLMFFALNRKRA